MRKITDFLDSVASRLQSNGLAKYAFMVDSISDKMEGVDNFKVILEDLKTLLKGTNEYDTTIFNIKKIIKDFFSNESEHTSGIIKEFGSFGVDNKKAIFAFLDICEDIGDSSSLTDKDMEVLKKIKGAFSDKSTKKS